MENQRLNELAFELSLRSGMSLEECELILQNILAFCESVANHLKQFADEAIKIWNTIKESLESCKENEAIHGWHVDWDTRKKSQVIDNRPSFAVRKIISVR